jgi:hypothetical protein
LSNTAFAGEKGVRADCLGGHKGDFIQTVLADQQDGPIYFGGLGVPNDLADLRTPGAIAYWSRRLAPERGLPLLPGKPRSDDPTNRFGGWHPGITLFLLGDGSARGMSNQTAGTVLQQLGCRNDRAGGSAGPAPAT